MPLENVPTNPAFIEPTGPDAGNEPTVKPDETVQTPKKTATKAAPRKATDERAKEDATVKPDSDVDEYAYVQMPDGSYRAIRKNQIQQINAISNADGTPEVPDQDVYVWLADGSVERVSEKELPGSAGTNALNGHFVRDGHTFLIVAVHPVETENPKG